MTRPIARTRALLAVLACAALWGSSACTCTEDKAGGKKAAKAAASAKAADKRAEHRAEPPDLSKVEVPTLEDFEEQAEQKITVENLETELDILEKEIGE
jgi:hypothetical protein